MVNRGPQRWLIAGLAMLAAALLATPGRAAWAQDLPPRPTAPPTAPVTPEPEQGDDDAGRDPAAPGRITGTVIDRTTGAPASGVAVRVGDTTVTSDANGNYDRSSLAAGSYAVALILEPGRGEPAQGELTVAVAAGQTVVQHLAFSSPLPAAAATAAPEPAATPAAITPISLPATGGGGAQGLPLALVGVALIAAGAIARSRR